MKRGGRQRKKPFFRRFPQFQTHESLCAKIGACSLTRPKKFVCCFWFPSSAGLDEPWPSLWWNYLNNPFLRACFRSKIPLKYTRIGVSLRNSENTVLPTGTSRRPLKLTTSCLLMMDKNYWARKQIGLRFFRLKGKNKVTKISCLNIFTSTRDRLRACQLGGASKINKKSFFSKISIYIDWSRHLLLYRFEKQ